MNLFDWPIKFYFSFSFVSKTTLFIKKKNKQKSVLKNQTIIGTIKRLHEIKKPFFTFKENNLNKQQFFVCFKNCLNVFVIILLPTLLINCFIRF